MIAVLKNGTTPSQIQHLVDWLKNMNLDVHNSEGSEVTILGLVGDTSRVDIDLLKRQGLRIILVGLMVFVGTFLGSAIIAEAVLRFMK